MHIESYHTSYSSDSKTYYFLSIGPKGKFPAIINFIKYPGIDVYNLEFGIENKDGTINDIKVLNNGDTKKILKTIANSVIEFSNEYPEASILIVGSTKSRTRLYQIMITKFYDEVSEKFAIYGETKEKRYEEFRTNTQYLSFLIERK